MSEQCKYCGTALDGKARWKTPVLFGNPSNVEASFVEACAQAQALSGTIITTCLNMSCREKARADARGDER